MESNVSFLRREIKRVSINSLIFMRQREHSAQFPGGRREGKWETPWEDKEERGMLREKRGKENGRRFFPFSRGGLFLEKKITGKERCEESRSAESENAGTGSGEGDGRKSGILSLCSPWRQGGMHLPPLPCCGESGGKFCSFPKRLCRKGFFPEKPSLFLPVPLAMIRVDCMIK